MQFHISEWILGHAAQVSAGRAASVLETVQGSGKILSAHAPWITIKPDLFKLLQESLTTSTSNQYYDHNDYDHLYNCHYDLS